MTEPSELRGLCVSHLMFRVKYCMGREKETVMEISALEIRVDPKIHLHRGPPCYTAVKGEHQSQQRVAGAASASSLA